MTPTSICAHTHTHAADWLSKAQVQKLVVIFTGACPSRPTRRSLLVSPADALR